MNTFISNVRNIFAKSENMDFIPFLVEDNKIGNDEFVNQHNESELSKLVQSEFPQFLRFALLEYLLI